MHKNKNYFYKVKRLKNNYILFLLSFLLSFVNLFAVPNKSVVVKPNSKNEQLVLPTAFANFCYQEKSSVITFYFFALAEDDSDDENNSTSSVQNSTLKNSSIFYSKSLANSNSIKQNINQFAIRYALAQQIGVYLFVQVFRI
jgi:hypothetical protein